MTSAGAREELLAKGFYYQKGEVTDGLPEFYRTAYHTHAYIRREWSWHFEVVAIHPQGVSNHHNAVLVRKRAA